MTAVYCYKSPEEGNLQTGARLNDTKMKCQQCFSGEEATCRVYSDALDMAVCAVVPMKLANCESMLSL